MGRGSSVWIWALAGAALTIRVVVALSRSDMAWPDEHFQSLEPAAKVVFGHGILSWEWLTGYRPWVIPGLYLPLFGALKLGGITGGLGVILLSRAFTAAFSTWVLLRMNRALCQCGVSWFGRLAGLGAFAFSVPMILWSATTLADNWAMVAVWGVLPEILRRIDKRDARSWLWVGILAGTPALIKLQLAFWVLGVGLAFWLIRVPASRIAWAALGGGLDLLALGALDAVTWGKPFQSLIRQASEGRLISEQQGVSPWWDYFPKVWRDQGSGLFLFLAALALAALVRSRARSILREKIGERRRQLIVTLLPMAFFLGAMMPIGHKETRFLLPVIPALYCLLALLIDGLAPASFSAKSKPQRVAFSAVAILILVAGSLASGGRALSTPIYLTRKNTAALEEAIRKDDGLAADGSGCVLLVDHSWEWTRGELVLGRPASLRNESLLKLPESDARNCAYAIVARFDSDDFRTFAGEEWASTNISRNGFVLYKRRFSRERSGHDP